MNTSEAATLLANVTRDVKKLLPLEPKENYTPMDDLKLMAKIRLYITDNPLAWGASNLGEIIVAINTEKILLNELMDAYRKLMVG